MVSELAAKLYFRNGSADRDKIWCVLGHQASMHITQAMGWVHLHVRTCARADVPPFSYLENGWTDGAEIWYVVRDSLAKRCTKVEGRVRLSVRTCRCAPFLVFWERLEGPR